jgi:ABC-type transporter Mla subunit MlaD
LTTTTEETTTKETVEEISTDFPRVVELGGDVAETAAEKLSVVCAELTKADVNTAVRRIRDVDTVVDTLPFPVIERLVAPDRVLAELDDVQAEPVRRLHSRRNQVALLPLLLTWLSIGFAVLLQDNEALLPIYGSVAVLDALLIGWVVLLTSQVHTRERAAAREYDRVAEHVDAAIKALAVAMANHASRAPVNAEEWAVAAREVLEETRQQTAELFESTMAAVDKASDNLTSVHTETEKLVGMLAEQSGKTLESLQQANEQMVTRVAKEAVAVLNSAVAEDRALVSEQLAPLVEQFQANVESFARNFDTYQENTAAFVAVTSDVGVATQLLGESAKSYTDIAESIDAHLRNIEGSQENFIQQVTESARNMGTAAGAMETMSTLLSDRLRADLETITGQLSSSSARLAAVDTNLVQTTEALGQAAGQMRDAADAIGSAMHGRRWFRRR